MSQLSFGNMEYTNRIDEERKMSEMKEIQRQLAMLRNDPHELEYHDLAETAAMETEGWE